MKNFVLVTTLASSLIALGACGKSKKSDTTAEDEVAIPEIGDGTEGFGVTGKIMLTTSLTASSKITHVVALNTGSGRKLAFPVDTETGVFKLVIPTRDEKDYSGYIRTDGTLNRSKFIAEHPEVAADIEGMTDAEVIAAINEGGDEEKPAAEPSPWTLAYVDATKVGADMIVSRFAAETLDTISPTLGNAGLAMGEVTPGSDGKATTTADYASILEAIDMDTATASTFGAIDDVSLRYINPDIDGDGVLDSPVVNADGTVTGTEVRYNIDFHNRFSVKAVGGAQVDHTSLKNKFADEVVGGLTNLDVAYTGTGITPELEKDIFAAAPTSYKWKFEKDITVPSLTCTELPAGGTVAAGSWCTHTYTENTNYDRYQLGQQLDTPPEGTYVLDAGEKVLTWTNVKVSDFSAGTGFVILLVKYNTNDKGTVSTADDVLSGIDYKYLKKTSAGWVAATESELKLLIKDEGGTLSLKFDSDALNCGVKIPKLPSGTIDVTTAKFDASSTNTATETLISDLNAGTVLWSRFSSGAASYDDKLGMRFFF